MISYEILIDANNNKSIIGEMHGIRFWVPQDDSAKTYQEYLAWLEQGNTPKKTNV